MTYFSSGNCFQQYTTLIMDKIRDKKYVKTKWGTKPRNEPVIW